MEFKSIIFGLATMLSLLVINSADAILPGDACPTGNECADATTFMECFEAACRCQGDAGKTYYDTADSKCHKIVGEECRGTTIKTPCPVNGACNAFILPPICACNLNEDFIETPTKKCAKAYEGGCTITNECDRDAFMSCTGTPKTCNCDAATSKYDATSKTCKLLLNTPCKDEATAQLCGLYTECKNDRCTCIAGLVDNGKGDCRTEFGKDCTVDGPACDESKFHICDDDSHKCACESGMTDIGGGKCQSKLGQSCDGGKECHEAGFLTCDDTDKTCKCTAGLEDNGNGECRTMLDGACGTDVKPECNDGNFLICGTEGKCACKDPLVANTAGKCRAQYDASCDSVPCDELSYLTCSGGKKCACMAGVPWNPTTQKCRARFNQPCGDDKPCDESLFLECPAEGDDKKCACRADLIDINNGQCRAKIDESCEGGVKCNEREHLTCNAENKCQCDDPFLPNIDNKCRVSNEHACSATIPCDEKRFLTCVANKCACDVSSSFAQDQDTCLFLVDDVCKLDLTGPQCAPNSYCSGDDGAGNGKCTCVVGMSGNSLRRCALRAGATCDPFNPVQQCDVTQFHHCDEATATCECDASDDTIDESAGECRLRANAPCSVAPGTKQCTTYSTCIPIAGKHSCVCDAELSASDSGKCVLSFGAECSASSHGRCDADAFVTCDGAGRCSCINSAEMEYDHSTEKCYITLNKPCVPGGEIKCQEHLNEQCNPTDKACKCAEGYTENADGKCTKNPTSQLFTHFHQKLYRHSMTFARGTYNKFFNL